MPDLPHPQSSRMPAWPDAIAASAFAAEDVLEAIRAIVWGLGWQEQITRPRADAPDRRPDPGHVFTLARLLGVWSARPLTFGLPGEPIRSRQELALTRALRAAAALQTEAVADHLCDALGRASPPCLVALLITIAAEPEALILA